MIIRPESSSDYTAVRQLHVDAFPTPSEADLVEQLRSDGDALISLVASSGDRVIGHVMFSRMTAPFNAIGLAPISVTAGERRRGVASALIKDGITRARTSGCAGIFVLGDVRYYQRFSFSSDAAAPFQSPYSGPHLMLLVLDDRLVGATSGPISYAPAFTNLG